MQFYFDIRLDDRFQRDHDGQDFDSAAEARGYVIESARACLSVASEAEKAKLARCSVSIVDSTGACDFITFADIANRPDPRSLGPKLQPADRPASVAEDPSTLQPHNRNGAASRQRREQAASAAEGRKDRRRAKASERPRRRSK
jgi:hypothetical protein